MPGYDPIRDSNPSPSRETFDAGLVQRKQSSASPATSLENGVGNRVHQQSEDAQGSEEPGLRSPLRTRASVADMLNPSSSNSRAGPPPSGKRWGAAPISELLTLRPISPTTLPAHFENRDAPPMSAPPLSHSMQFSSPFGMQHSAAHTAREERSPSLHNLLDGGEAGPLVRGSQRDRSRSVSTSRSDGRIAGGQPQAPLQFATLLNGPTPVTTSPPVTTAPLPGEAVPHRATSDGFLVPDRPAQHSPDSSMMQHKKLPGPSSSPDVSIVGRKLSQVLTKSQSTPKMTLGQTMRDAGGSPMQVRQELPATAVPVPPTPGSESGTSAAGASEGVPSEKAEEDARKEESEPEPTKPVRRKSAASGVRRKRDSMVIPDEDLMPISGGPGPAVKKQRLAATEDGSGKLKEDARKSTSPVSPSPAQASEPQTSVAAPAAKSSAATLKSSPSMSAKPLSPDGSSEEQSNSVKGTPYHPVNRVTRPFTIMRPISTLEIDMLKKRHKNPLRTQAERDAGISRDNDRVEAAGEVAEHYNRREDVGVKGRENSRIFPLRKFNNWIKSVIIGRFACSRPEMQGSDPVADERNTKRRKVGGRVLELGCGKGGDLAKWERARASQLVMIDIAAVSVEHAKARYLSGRHCYSAEFFAFDCFSLPLEENVPEELLAPLFDNVSLQFCMHYAWSDVPKVRILLENISKHLRKGGVFLGTIPDGEKLIARLQDLPGDELKFGNSIYSVEFEQKQNRTLFGHKYKFFLADAVEDVPEFVVDWTQFESLAFEYGMKKVYRKNFLGAFEEEKSDPDFGVLLERMGVVNRVTKEPELDAEMWEAASIYQAFAFEKFR